MLRNTIIHNQSLRDPSYNVILFFTFSFQMGKKPDDNENRQSIKKMMHSEMMDRGLVIDKKKKTRSSRDRSRPVSSFFISRVTKLVISNRIRAKSIRV